ncbi:hypothetical protein D3C85_1818130 [compost metagenome]
MAAEVGRDLVLGFDHKAQADLVADLGGDQANGKSPGKPQWIEQAGPLAQRIEARA